MAKDIFEQEEIIDWSVIENYEKEDTIASWSMALAELVKLLHFLLEDQGYLGHSLEEKVKKAKVRFTDIKGLKSSLGIYQKVFKEYGEAVTLLDLKEAVNNLKKAVKDLTAESDFSPPTLLERIKSNCDYYFSDRERFYRWALFFLSGLVVLFVLDSTHFGQRFISTLAAFFYSILSWLILTGVIIGALLILALGTIFFLGRGK